MLTFLALSLATANVTTIVVDHRQTCGYGRIADAERATAESKARKLQREVRKAGGNAKIVHIRQGVDISPTPGIVIIDNRC